MGGKSKLSGRISSYINNIIEEELISNISEARTVSVNTYQSSLIATHTHTHTHTHTM